MANRDSGQNYGNTGGNRENQGQGNKGQEKTPGQDRGRNMPGQPGQPGQGGQQGDVRNESSDRDWNRSQNPNDPNRGSGQSDSGEDV